MFEMLGATFGATLAGCLALAGTAGAAVYFFMRRKHEAELLKREEERRAISFQQMQTIVTEELRNVRELITVRKNFTSDISFADDKKIPWLNVHMPRSNRKFQMSYSGTITCGCDLDAIRFEQDFLTGRVKIIVPPSRIFDEYIDMNTVKIHHQSKEFFADEIKLEHQQEMLTTDLAAHVERAVREGILNQADGNVRTMLQSIIMNRRLNQNFDFDIIFLGNSSRQNLLR